MSRIPELDPAALSAEQRQLHAEITGGRGGAPRGPFAVWLHNPGLAAAANGLANQLRREGRLDRRLFELMILLMSRHWSAQYAWAVHAPLAGAAGLDEAVIEAIRTGQAPAFDRPDEALVHDLVTELNRSRALSAATYARAVETLGLDLVIELVSGAGFYAMVAMVLQAFDAPAPDRARPLPPSACPEARPGERTPPDPPPSSGSKEPPSAQGLLTPEGSGPD